jgi:hypothetical protein
MMSKEYIIFIVYDLFLNMFPIGLSFYIFAITLYFLASILFDELKGGNEHVQSI